MIEKITDKLTEKVNEWFEIWRNEDDEYADGKRDGFAEAIEIVQEVAKDGGWIPVEQRMPENKSYGEVYWVTLRDKLGIVCVRKMRWYGKGKWVWMNGQDLGSEWEVTAWKVYEIPEPYQKGK